MSKGSIERVPAYRLLVFGLAIAIALVGCSPATPSREATQSTAGEGGEVEPTAEPTEVSGEAEPTGEVEPPGAAADEERLHTLIIGISADISGWDPAESFYAVTQEIVVNTHDNLLSVAEAEDEYGNPVRDNDTYVPALAESYEVSDDGKVITFHLREDATFNNGDPVDAQAIKDAIRHYLSIPNSERRFNFSCSIYNIDQIEVVDEYTFNIHLEEYNSLLLKWATKPGFTIMNTAEIEAHGATKEEQQKWSATNVTGSGPYYIAEYEPGEQLVFKAIEGYWGGTPYFTTVIYKVVPEAENRLLLLRNGDIDIAYEIPVKDISTLENDPGITVHATPTFGTMFMLVGPNTPPWDDVRLREAIAYAVPYQTIIDEVTYGYAKPAKSWLSAGIEGYIPASPYVYDPEKAKELLAEAGYPEGEGLPTLKINIKTGVPEDEATAVYIQSELENIGINAEIVLMTPAAHTDQISKHQLPLTTFFFLPYVTDPYYAFHWILSGANAEAGCCNYTSYDNPYVNERINLLFSERDPEVRAKAIAEIQQSVAEDLPILPLYQPTWNLAMRSDIKGYSFYPDALVRLHELYREQ